MTFEIINLLTYWMCSPKAVFITGRLSSSLSSSSSYSSLLLSFRLFGDLVPKNRPSDVGKSENYGVYISVTAKFFVCWTCMVLFIIYSRSSSSSSSLLLILLLLLLSSPVLLLRRFGSPSRLRVSCGVIVW